MDKVTLGEAESWLRHFIKPYDTTEGSFAKALIAEVEKLRKEKFPTQQQTELIAQTIGYHFWHCQTDCEAAFNGIDVTKKIEQALKELEG